MIFPILSYGMEIWACFGWRRQEIRNMKQYRSKASFWKIALIQNGKNALEINKNVSNHVVKAKMGAFPMMGFLIEQLFSYWQHLLASSHSGKIA